MDKFSFSVSRGMFIIVTVTVLLLLFGVKRDNLELYKFECVSGTVNYISHKTKNMLCMSEVSVEYMYNNKLYDSYFCEINSELVVGDNISLFVNRDVPTIMFNASQFITYIITHVIFVLLFLIFLFIYFGHIIMRINSKS